MYQLSESTITKRVESWRLIVPLHDNSGKDFDDSLIESITQGIVTNFPGLTAINCVGYWSDGSQTYHDRNLELIIDVAPAHASGAEEFFAKYKADLAIQLKQSKIYLTREQSKNEVLSYDEFFAEVGLEIMLGGSNSEKRKVAQSAIENVNFLISRMSYETTLLRRDEKRKVVIWERRICGIQLRSEIPDETGPGTQLIAADRVDQFVEWLKQPSDALIIGDWEYQKFVLSKRFVPLVEAQIPKGKKLKLQQYLSQQGEPISHKRFIEEFTMVIICGVMALRDEGFLPDEISVSVGGDGSLQWTTAPDRNIIFFSPAPVPDKSMQREILRCVRISLKMLVDGELPPLAVQQAKALHRYIFKRGAVRSVRQEKSR